ncbi:MAG: hypothetical protein ACKOCX_06650 [Planctomycetota bacterium]
MKFSPSSPPPRLSETTQAVVSVALIAYLLGLVLSIAANSVSGSSALLRTIKARLFTPWMAPAWLDLGFDHPLTYGMPEDADHLVELRAFAGGEPLRLPGGRTGERAARWRRLARRIAAATAAGEDEAAALAAGVGQGGFAPLGSEDVTVRVLRRPLAERSSPPARPRLVEAYAARVRRVEDEMQLVELGGEAKRGELAPVIRPASSADTPDGEEATP